MCINKTNMRLGFQITTSGKYEARVSDYNLRQSATSYINDQRYKENQESAIEIPALHLSLCQIYYILNLKCTLALG